MQAFICKNITELETPVGYFFVTDGDNNIPFSIRKNTFDVPYHIYDNNQQVIGELKTETNFDFKLLDYSHSEIVFKVAWIKNDSYDKETYEDALDFWLT